MQGEAAGFSDPAASMVGRGVRGEQGERGAARAGEGRTTIILPLSAQPVTDIMVASLNTIEAEVPDGPCDDNAKLTQDRPPFLLSSAFSSFVFESLFFLACPGTFSLLSPANYPSPMHRSSCTGTRPPIVECGLGCPKGCLRKCGVKQV